MAIQLVILFAPTYINKVLGYSLMKVGFAAALPTLLQFSVKMFAGALSDRITSLGETLKVRVFNAIAFGGMATFFTLLAIIPTANLHYLALALLVFATTILGFNVGGFFKSATLVGQQYAYFVNTIVQVINLIIKKRIPVM